MLSRALPAVRTLRAIARVQSQAVRCMSGGPPPADWKTDRQLAIEAKTTLDNIPVPSGSWQEEYNRRNAKYNTFLLASLAFFVISWGAVYQFGALYLHSEPPLKSIKMD